MTRWKKHARQKEKNRQRRGGEKSMPIREDGVARGERKQKCTWQKKQGEQVGDSECELPNGRPEQPDHTYDTL